MRNIITTLAATGQTINKVGTDNDLAGNIINILDAIIGALGLLAVVIIILGGVQYMTSSGDAAKVKKGKDTILYGIIGLVIVALAFAIVNFVIGNILAQESTS
jgi:hypothetical protein